jgi:hypothetical protein
MASTFDRTPDDRNWNDRFPKETPQRDIDPSNKDRPDQTNWETGDLPGDPTTGSKDPKKNK